MLLRPLLFLENGAVPYYLFYFLFRFYVPYFLILFYNAHTNHLQKPLLTEVQPVHHLTTLPIGYER